MARKRAGDFLNILSDPEKREGLVEGKTPVSFQRVQPSGGQAFPGMVGLGSGSRTGVPPVRTKGRAKGLLDDDDAGKPRIRMDLALAALLGVLVTNIVSFTLGARAGRQSVEPGTTAVTASEPAKPKALEILTQAEPKQPAAAVAKPDTSGAPAPGSAPKPFESGPTLPPALSGAAPAGGNPGVNVPVRPTPEPTPQPTPTAAPADMAGRYVVRLISLKYDDRGKKTAEKIRKFVETKGFAPGIVRTSRGWLVVEAGAWKSYDEAKRAQSRIRTLKLGFNKFETAYVIQRPR